MFYLNTKIFFGAGAVSQGKEHIAALGSKALLVTGRRSAISSGALDDVLALLKELHISWQVFDQVGENPDLDTIMQGATMMSGSGCDLVIGIGGGSPLDAAKAISTVCANQLGIDEIYHTEKFHKAYPIVAIPTTSGTGSEATQYSVLTDLRSGKKAGWGHPLAFPRLALVDPAYTLSTSCEVTQNTAIDALSHLLEGLYCRQREPLIFPLIHKGIALIVQHLPRALQNPDDLPARAALSQASLYGGMTIAQGSTSLQHSIGYPLTSAFGVPHGLANGIVMPQIMELFWDAVGDLVTDALASFGMDRPGFLTWLSRLGLKAEMQIDEAFIRRSVPEVMASRNMANNPLEISPQQIASVYRSLMR